MEAHGSDRKLLNTNLWTFCHYFFTEHYSSIKFSNNVIIQKTSKPSRAHDKPELIRKTFVRSFSSSLRKALARKLWLCCLTNAPIISAIGRTRSLSFSSLSEIRVEELTKSYTTTTWIFRELFAERERAREGAITPTHVCLLVHNSRGSERKHEINIGGESRLSWVKDNVFFCSFSAPPSGRPPTHPPHASRQWSIKLILMIELSGTSFKLLFRSW